MLSGRNKSQRKRSLSIVDLQLEFGAPQMISESETPAVQHFVCCQTALFAVDLNTMQV